MKLKLSEHLIDGTPMVEVRDYNGLLIAGIYATPRGVKVVSKLIDNRPDLVVIDPQFPPAVLINVLPC